LQRRPRSRILLIAMPPVTEGGNAFGVPSRREIIIAMLAEAYARDDLEQHEFERRVERAEAAQTLEQLEALIHDFPPEARATYGGAAGPSVPAPGAYPVLTQAEIEAMVERLDGEPAPTRFSLMGNLRVLVRPTDVRVLRDVSAIGDSHIDLRPLAGESGVFLLKVVALVGNTRIMVPAGTRVEIRTITVIGDQKRKDARGGGLLARLGRTLSVLPESPEAPRGPPGPVVVVTGFKLIGDVVIVEG